MKILVTGSSGFIGSSLIPFLRACGHQPIPLRRSEHAGGGASWFPEQERIDLGPAEGIDGVIHLAGEPIVGRWTESKKQRIRASRAEGTRLLCEGLAEMPSPPSVLVSASAIGYYGDRGEELLDEGSQPGRGFLPEIAQVWESATIPAHAKGIRVVHLRIGLVLSPQGGALAKMLHAFRWGLGGRVGSGRQYWSWIALGDLHSAMLHALVQPTLSGPVNGVAPHPATNLEFTRTLAKVLFRPALLPVPEFLLRGLLGEMAEATLLSSARVAPARLLETGFTFDFPELERALRHLLRC